MGLFAKQKKTAGWMTIVPQQDGICACHVTRVTDALPVVDWIAYYPHAGNDHPLEKMAKDLSASRYQCTTLLRGNEYQILSVEAPTVPQEELKTAIRWRLKDMLDFKVDDATIDVLDVPGDQNAPGRSRSMYAIAARNQIIQQRQTAFLDAKIPLSAIDIPDLAQRNISALLEPEGWGLAVLSFDGDGGLLTISFAGELYLTRRIDIALAQLTQADAEQKAVLYDKITLELQRSLDHFERQYHFISMSKLLLGPMLDAGPGLATHLADNLYMTVELLKLEDILDLGKVVELNDPETQQRFFLTLGAALRLEEKAS